MDNKTNRLPPERKCLLVVSEDVHLGLLIRGGLEHGLGIYITGLDPGSAAEAADLQVGSFPRWYRALSLVITAEGSVPKWDHPEWRCHRPR